MSRRFLSASSQYLICQTTPVLVAPFSITAWVNLADLSADRVVVSIADSGTTNNWWRVWFEAAAVRLRFSVAAGASSVGAQPGVAPIAGKWHLFAAVEASAIDRRAFQDGGNMGTNATSRAPTGIDRVAIGAEADSSIAVYMNGKIGLVTIWGGILTNQDIAGLYRGRPPTGIMPLASWDISGRSPREWDSVGTHHMESVNGPTPDEWPPVARWSPRSRGFRVPAAGGAFQAAWARNANALWSPGSPV